MIGFIGLGQMGRPMVKNILKCGFPIVVWNRTIEKAYEFQEYGAEIAKNPEDLGNKADTVILMLADSEAVESTIFGNKGLYNSNVKIIIDMSTISPFKSIEFSKRLLEKNIKYLDAPVIGSVQHAEKAELNILVGGDLDTFNRVLYIFKCLGKNIYYLGPNGYGLFMKIVNNMIIGANLAILSEALNLGERVGLNKKLMLDILSLGTANSKVLELKKNNLINENFEPAFKLKHEAKDLFYSIETARKLNIPVPLTSLVHQLYESGISNNLGELDYSSIFLLFKKNLSRK